MTEDEMRYGYGSAATNIGAPSAGPRAMYSGAGQAPSALAPHPMGALTSAINELKVLSNVIDNQFCRIDAFADRVIGTEPQCPAPNSSPAFDTSSELGQLSLLMCQMQVQANRLSDLADRLERVA